MTTIDNILTNQTTLEAYCNAWQESFSKANPFHSVRVSAEDLIHIQAGLRAALAQQVAQGWQPIETVPTETEVFIGRFIDGKFKFGRSEMFYEQANEFAGETFSGWVWAEDECSSSITESPTHWMPLPTPPKGGV